MQPRRQISRQCGHFQWPSNLVDEPSEVNKLPGLCEEMTIGPAIPEDVVGGEDQTVRRRPKTGDHQQ